jgi:hypothetical protein
MNGLKWSLVRVETHYQWYRDGTYWKYEPVELTTKIASGTIDVTGTDAGTISSPVDWGRYRLDVSSPEDAGPISSVEFHAGWYVEASSTDTPDGLEIALDKAEYAPGDTAQLKISPRFAGEALITIGSERCSNLRRLGAGRRNDRRHSGQPGLGCRRLCHCDAVPSGRCRGNAHADARHRRQMARRRPGRAQARRRARRADRIEPNSTLTVPVSVAGLNPGEEAYVTLAAVDVGILNLTLRAAGARRLVFRPAPPRSRNARPLWPADRRLGGRNGQAAHRRRRHGARFQGQPADRKAAGALFRHRPPRRRTARRPSPSTCRSSTARRG